MQNPLSPNSATLSADGLASDDISSHVKTLDYLGLDDPSSSPRRDSDTPLPPLPTLFDLRRQDANRIRSYSVSAKERYDQEEQFAHGMENLALGNAPVSAVRRFQQQQQTRPRAISLGTLEGGPDSMALRSASRTPYEQKDSIYGYPKSVDYDGSYLAQMSAHTTPRGGSPDLHPSTPPAPQSPTRSLWVGNIDANITTQDLMQAFSPYGAIESLRVLPEKECGFVNYFRLEDAMRARDDIMNRLGGRVATSTVRIGYGKVDGLSPMNEGALSSGQSNNPTRALWIGNIPTATTPAMLLNIFAPYGPIESARVLTHKNCGFVNFERLDDAVRSRKALNGKELMGPEVGPVRIGYAKVPTLTKAPSSETGTPEPMDPMLAQTLRQVVGSASVPVGQQSGPIENYHSNMVMSMVGSNPLLPSADATRAPTQQQHSQTVTEQRLIMRELSGPNDISEEDEQIVSDIRPVTTYYTTVPVVPESSANRKYDASKLRDIRKRLDNGHCPPHEVEALAGDMLDECVELSSDYIGNTVIQKLFEKCTDSMKTRMLERIAPHLAMIGIHKHGTWAAQKIIDCASTPQHMHLITTNLRPYTPPLLLDQFGNYVVQCCLRLGSPYNQFMYDAMLDRCWEIAQGRFGARAMRACLESPTTTKVQQKQVAIAVVLNSVPLSTNANGALLLTWFIDTSNFPGRFKVLAPRLVPHLAHLCTHKLASLTVLKLVNQRVEPESRDLILQALFYSPNDQVLEDVLSDQVHGVGVVQKILASSFLDSSEKINLCDKVKQVLTKLRVQHVQGYRRLMEEVGMAFTPEPMSAIAGNPYQTAGMGVGGYAYGPTAAPGQTRLYQDMQPPSWNGMQPTAPAYHPVVMNNSASAPFPTQPPGLHLGNSLSNGRKSTSPGPGGRNVQQTPPAAYYINGMWYLASNGVPVDRRN